MLSGNEAPARAAGTTALAICPAAGGRRRVPRSGPRGEGLAPRRDPFIQELPAEVIGLLGGGGLAPDFDRPGEVGLSGVGIRDPDVCTRFVADLLDGPAAGADEANDVEALCDGFAGLKEWLWFSELPAELFRATDALGWVYQFWQTEKKDEVNASGKKIGADELSPVTQLFTEDYMVDFLLDNTLGAWWAGKVLAKDPRLATGAKTEAIVKSVCYVKMVIYFLQTSS
jgi:hypothetical protein